MEDEAAEQRYEQKTVDGPSLSTLQAPQAVAGAMSRQAIDYAAVSNPAPCFPNVGASTTWQQKVLDVEAKLQGDLQQDLARSVFSRYHLSPDKEANSLSALHQYLASMVRLAAPQTIAMRRALLPSITLVTMTSLISPPTPVWLSHDSLRYPVKRKQRITGLEPVNSSYSERFQSLRIARRTERRHI